MDPALRAPALSGAGTLSWRGGHLEASRDYHRRALEDYRRIGDERGIAWSTMCLATQDVVAGDLDSAWMQATTACPSPRESGNTRIVAATQTLLGVHRVLSGRCRTRGAAPDWTASPRRGRPRIPGPPASPSSTCPMSPRAPASTTARWATSARRSRSAARPATSGGTARHRGSGELLLRLGAPRRAARLLAAADRYRIDYAQPLDDHERGLKDQIIEETRAAVGEVAFAVAWSEGATCTLEEAVSEPSPVPASSQSDSATG